METRPLGRSPLAVPPICLGTMTFGEQSDAADARAQLDLAIERGINFIDTAELYAVPPRAETYGAIETIVGNWLKRQDRAKIILATKVAGPGRTMTWIRGGSLNFARQGFRAVTPFCLQHHRRRFDDGTVARGS